MNDNQFVSVSNGNPPDLQPTVTTAAWWSEPQPEQPRYRITTNGRHFRVESLHVKRGLFRTRFVWKPEPGPLGRGTGMFMHPNGDLYDTIEEAQGRLNDIVKIEGYGQVWRPVE